MMQLHSSKAIVADYSLPAMRDIIKGIDDWIGIVGLCVTLILPIVSSAGTVVCTPLALISAGII